MGKKYIIELLDKCNSKLKGIMLFGLTQEKQISVELIPEEDLTPYTEPDLEQVRKKAYLEGLKDGQAVTVANEQNNAFNDGYKKCLKDMEQVRKEEYENGYENGFVAGHLKAEKSGQKFYEDGYKRGLADAWEAARKIANTPYGEEEKVFGSDGWTFVANHTAEEAIEKIRQYEQALNFCQKCGYRKKMRWTE